MSYRGYFLAVALLAGCGSLQTTPPGLGPLSAETKARFRQDRLEADLASVERAARVANRSPGNLRAQRKVAELAARVLARENGEANPQQVLAWVGPVLARLSSGCETRAEAAHVYRAAGSTKEAANLYVRAARDCHDPTAALSAAGLLKSEGRCDEAVGLLAKAWPRARQEERVPVLDAVNECSDPTSLRRNLQFISKEERDDYFDLLQRRAEEEERRRQAELERRRQAADAQRRGMCMRECDNARSQCHAGCGSSSSCHSHCDAYSSSCRSHCY